jgi:hypothetical protein
MYKIRQFIKDDIDPVADLWVRAYRNREPPAPESLKRYFGEIYFSNPWYDLDLPSYVYEEASGEITGFVAVFPRMMTFNRRPIKVAVLSTIMVDPRKRRSSICVQLMEKVLGGSQDLCYTDGANRDAGMLWEAVGGEVCLLYSCHWIKILRPSAYLLEVAKARKSLRPLARLLAPAAAAIDPSAVRMPLSPYRVQATTAVGEDATPESLNECISQFSRQCSLVPIYDLNNLDWLLRQAAEATNRGQLETVIVKSSAGARLGWYVYLAKRGGVSEVLQLGGTRRAIQQVLYHLFHHARSRGSLAVRGQFEPRFVSELSDARCVFSFQDIGVFIHSRDKDLCKAIHQGDTALSRLEGEWWMHFADGPWLSDLDILRPTLKAEPRQA